MGIWPTQADENQLPFRSYTWKHRPPLSSRPERRAVEGPAVVFRAITQCLVHLNS
jgi:hypothetical protein